MCAVTHAHPFLLALTGKTLLFELLRILDKMNHNPFATKKKVAIIGAAGRMGLWFTKYFMSKGGQTTVSDLETEEVKKTAQQTGALYASDNTTAVYNADYVFLCTPIKTTSSLITELLPHMKKGSVLAEITSIKSGTFEALKKTAYYGIKPLSIHPMFGPSTDSIEGVTIVVVPVNNQCSEEMMAKSLFPGANIRIADLIEHDKIMSINLSLTYFINLALGSTLSTEDVTKLKSLAGTSFTLQLALLESIVNEDPKLVEVLLFENPLNLEYIEKFIQEINQLRDLLIERGKIQAMLNKLRAHYELDPDFSSSDKRRYEAYKALRK